MWGLNKLGWAYMVTFNHYKISNGHFRKRSPLYTKSKNKGMRVVELW